ncbi:MAG TPA: NAD(P)-dependent oxidoreductase [Solirubrobacterales bacterium]|jgi:nucleoside-diphosphate-sugar epimerase|nr:NAD(P)-dependent oxidoreductase [Solirubrobacterales bacterium]
MKVFVAGASGAIGRQLVPQLLAAGHEVTGMTRREENAEAIRAAGAKAVVCDVFDTVALESAVGEAAPEAVVHELTALPPRLDPKAKDNPLAPTNRLRVEGTRNLIAAAKAAGARRLIAESVAFFYVPEGDWVKGEDAPAFAEAPGPFGEAAKALADLERQVTGTEGLEGVVLRYGWLYGPGTYYDRDGSQTEDFHKRRMPIVGKGTGTFSFIQVEDAASAAVAAVERGAPGIYNVVDDEPAPLSDWAPAFAGAVGAKKPLRVPVWLARLLAGSAAVEMTTAQRGAANAKAKRELGWQPHYPSWRRGFADPAARG